MTREQLSALSRLLAGIGVLLLVLAFLRACASPPQLPGERYPAPDTVLPDAGNRADRY